MVETSVETQEVIIELSGAEYGIPAACVKEIVRLVEITPIPESSECVKGAIDYRGSIAVVIDLAQRLGIKSTPYNLNTQIIIVENEAGLVGLAVDRVKDVITINPAAVMRGRESELPDDITKGAYEDGDRLVILLNTAKILRVKKRNED